MSIKIALAGNPNSGKTTLFNYLTGSSQYVGNWPGVTVEKKEGRLKGHNDVVIQDLPGIYSLSPYSLEEVVSRDYLITEKPDSIINIVDASNLERNLYLTTQLLELGVPTVVVLNMMDIVEKHGDTIETDVLSKELGCEVLKAAAVKGKGANEVAEVAIAAANKRIPPKPLRVFSEVVEKALEGIENLIKDSVDNKSLRWFAIKLFERDTKVREQLELGEQTIASIEKIISECEKELDEDSESIITNERYAYISRVVDKSLHKKNKSKVSTSDRIDMVLTNRFLAIPIFAVVMFVVYFMSLNSIGGWASDWVNESLFGEIIPTAVEDFLVSVDSADWLISLIVDGIIAGVGAVLGFLPQMVVLFLCLSILEDCGYMARIAFIMDRIFRRFGLSGKSIIPMLVATGCGVPGIMASRTIENESDRKISIMTTTFMPCGAKIPVIALIAGALFGQSVWVAPAAYFIGIVAIMLSGIILKKNKAFSGDPSPFVMELPAYHLPNPVSVAMQVWDRSKSFVKKAGSIILLACVAVWFLSNFNWTFRMVDADDSILASLGTLLVPVFTPLGWGEWRAVVATLNGLIAKENVVGTLGVLYGFEAVAEDGVEVWTALQASFSQLSGFSFLIFNLICAPCVAAIGAIRREMGNAKWTLIAVGYQTGLAYSISFVTYQLGLVLTGHGFGFGSLIAFVVLAVFIYLLIRKPDSKGKLMVKRAAA